MENTLSMVTSGFVYKPFWCGLICCHEGLEIAASLPTAGVSDQPFLPTTERKFCFVYH